MDWCRGQGSGGKGLLVWIMQIKYKMWAGPEVDDSLSYSLKAISYLDSKDGCKTGRTFPVRQPRPPKAGELFSPLMSVITDWW